MSRTRRRNWYGYWKWSRQLNLLLLKISKERKIARDDWEAKDSVEEKSLPDAVFFGKVYSDYKGSYKWVKTHKNRKYRYSQKRKLREDYDSCVMDKIVKDIDFYYGD